jgi:hypothetical protein
MKATVNKISSNVKLKSKEGKDYTVSILEVLREDKTNKTIKIFEKDLIKKLNGFKKGDLIDLKYTKDGEYFKLVDIVNAAMLSSPHKSFETKPAFSTDGVIKGNSITNGVALATARKGNKTTLDDIREATMEILSLHKELESMTLSSLPGDKDENKKKTLDDVEDFDTEEDAF